MAYKILVVDDEPEVLNVLQSYLQQRGFEVVTAADPETALELMCNDRFQVALVDINLPRMSGVQLLKQMKGISPTMQVMMMTAYSKIETAIQCLEAGATDYFVKPFHALSEVAATVQAACERVTRWENATRYYRPGP